ncbi:hypothetical protein KUTeg_002291, partial [Tegillarca granosa]
MPKINVKQNISKTDWNRQAQETLKKSIQKRINTNVAKNVILFIGDGMGISTITAARILRGQQQGNSGEETVLEFEKFPNLALAKTYTVDKQVPDSGATSTAFLCGVKSNYYTLGLDDGAVYNNCSSQAGTEVSCVFDWFKDEAAGYAKSVNRLWEGTDSMTDIERGCKDIAHQLIYNNSHINVRFMIHVLFGGGRRYFLKQNTLDPKDGLKNNWAQRNDGIDLIEVWKKDKQDRNVTSEYVWNKKQFEDLNPETTDFALGLFGAGHLQYDVDRDQGPQGEPSLSEMTTKAIQILQRNEKGYFLLIESGRIDHAHHENNAYRSLTEMLEFENAIKEALKLTNEEKTLIIVTSDHDHVFNIAGYPKRGNDIFGVPEPISPGDIPRDGLPYTTLVYGNGPGYQFGNRENVRSIDTTHKDYRQASAVPLAYETHGGNDVPIYAIGPMSHLFYGTQEQNYIAHVMAYAACVGINKGHCTTTEKTSNISPRVLLSYNYFTSINCIIKT